MSDSAAPFPPARERHSRLALLLAGLAVVAWRRRGATVAVWLLLACLSAVAAALWLRVDTNPARMINPDLPFRQDYERLIRAFPLLDNTFVILVEGPRRREVRTVGRALVESFRARPDLFSHVLAPELSPMFDELGPLWLPLEEVRAMVARLEQAAPMLGLLAERPDLAGLARLMEALAGVAGQGRAPPVLSRFLRDLGETVAAATRGVARPLDWQRLGLPPEETDNNATHLLAVIVKPVLDFSALDPAAAAMAEARRITRDPETISGHDVRIWLTGEAAMNAEEFSTVTTGAVFAGLLSLAIVTLVIVIGLPVRRLIVPALALIILGLLVNAGFTTLAVGELNMISVAFAVLFIGLGVDYAIHFLLRYAEELALPPHAAPRPLARAAAGTGPALLLAAGTTALAFLAFLPTDFVGMAQLGIIAAGGIIIAFVATLTLLPALLAFMPMPDPPSVSHTLPSGPVRHVLSRLRGLRPYLAAAIMTAGLAGIVLLPQVRFDGDPVNLRDPKAPSVQAFRRLLREDPALVYAISALASDRAAAERLARRLAALPQVKKARTALDLLPRRQPEKLALLRTLRGVVPETLRPPPGIGHEGRLRAMRRLISALHRIKGSDTAPLEIRRAAADLAGRLEAFLAARGNDARALARLEAAIFVRLPELLHGLSRLLRAGPVTLDNLDPDLRRHYIAPDGTWRVEAIPAAPLFSTEALRDFARAVRSAVPGATGAPVEIVGAADVVSRAMLAAILLSLVSVIVLVMLATRRLVDALLALAPIVIAASLLLSWTVLADTPFNFANVIVIPLLFGLGVDSAIHYLHRARESTTGAAVDHTSTPRAITISMLTTLGSFGTLWLTPHRGLSSMGELLTVSIVFMLLTTLVVLPQLIDWLRGPKGRSLRP
jgi:hypothetical protein